MDVASPRPRRGRRARPGLRDRNAPGRRPGTCPRAGAARPRSPPPRRHGRTRSPAAPFRRAPSASSTVTLGASRLDLDRRQASRRGARHRGSSATTAKSAWPWKETSSTAKSGSSPKAGETSFFPGMSAAVRTATTPGRRAHRSKIECGNAPARHRRLPTATCKRAVGLADIVDVLGRALHMLGGGIMRQSAMDVAKGLLPSPLRGGSGVRGEGVELKRAEWISARQPAESRA